MTQMNSEGLKAKTEKNEGEEILLECIVQIFIEAFLTAHFTMFPVLASLAFSALFTLHEEKSFIQWMRSTNQVYTGEEYHVRFGLYMTSLRYVEQHNKKSSFRLSMNQFAAMTPAEYKSLLGFRYQRVERKFTPSKNINVDEVDWRTKNVVTPVKSMGDCAASWAFSAVGGCESAWAIAGNTLTPLSEQSFIDCVDTCHGCTEGMMEMALFYFMMNKEGMIMSDADYPYKGAPGECKYDQKKAIAKMVTIYDISDGSESDLAAKCAEHGPACCAIDAHHYSFQLYSSGVYDEPTCSPFSLDYGVLLVGYGKTDKDVGYWILKNSWGTKWGESGYIRMLKDGTNQCGVASMACIVTAK